MTGKKCSKVEAELRQKWLLAAREYYLSPGDDTGMADLEWDAIARELHSKREIFPDCEILNDPSYEGGSLFWVKRVQYETALQKHVP